MRFPLEVVVPSKQDDTCRRHIKYANNVDLKIETNYLDGKSSKIYLI
jgi:hypothetical protein